MAANLDYRANGVAAFVTLKLAGWHDEGTVMHDVMTVDEARTLAGHDFDAQAVPTFYRHPLTGEWTPSNAKSILRMDRGTELAFGLTDKYKVLQFSALWETARPLVEAGLARIETGGTLAGGERAFVLLQLALPDGTFNGGDDPRVCYVLLHATHDGKAVASARMTTVRVVCANTERMSLTGHSAFALKVPHRGNVVSRFTEAAEGVYGYAIREYRESLAALESLKAVRLSRPEFVKNVLDVILPLPVIDGESSARAKTERDKMEAKRAELSYLWTDGIGNTGEMTAYDALNAVTQATTHKPELFIGRKTDATWTDRITTGTLATVQQRASDNLLALAAA
jgi:phage/plasmid-like protein (TIGR03299 family)